MSAALKWNAWPDDELARDRRTAQREPVLGHGAGDDGDRAAGQVVVVKAGVVVVHPADQPDRDVVVAVQLLVVALLARVADEVRPALRRRRQLADEPLERGAVELAHSTRSGFATVSACSAAAPSADSGTGDTTGRSEP